MSAGSAIDSSVTLDEVFSVLAAKRVPLAPELAGYLVLEVAERADPTGGDIDARSVFVGEEGTVALVKPRREGPSGDAEASIRATLARLLDASGSVTPALAAASRRRSGAGLHALAEELETALIPVNRAAGRRALARLAREVRRVTLGVGRNALPSSNDAASTRRPLASVPVSASGETPPPPASSRAPGPGFSTEDDSTTTHRVLPSELLHKAAPSTWTELPTVQFEPPPRRPSPSQADVDALIDRFGITGGVEPNHARALKALVGLDLTPPPPMPGSPPTAAPALGSRTNPSRTGDLGLDAILGMTSTEPPPPALPAVDGRHERQLPTQPSRVRTADTSLTSPPPHAPRRGRLLLATLGVLVVACASAVAWALRPGAASRATPAAASIPALTPANHSVMACRGTLVVSNAPPHAEVLIGEGQAPVDVERLPVGARLEFVATAEGYAPKRVVVPAGALWDHPTDGVPRYEAAVQMDRSKNAIDSWPAGEPGSEVGGEGSPGTVHVVATPRGAEIWMLAGMGPDARVEQLPCDHDWDVLVAGPTTFRQRLHVSAGDFRLEEPAGGKVARVSAK